MASSEPPHPFPTALRLLLAVVALGLIVGSFSVIAALFRPGQYVSASRQAALNPGLTTDLNKLPILNFSRYLYLVGPIVPAAGDPHRSLFPSAEGAALAPAVLSDAAGAVEVLSPRPPLTAEPAEEYRFGEMLHLLGWRTSENGFTLFAIAKTPEGLQNLLSQKGTGWRKTVFKHGLLLIAMVFVIFWCLNLSLLSTSMLRTEQLLIVNLVFLVLYYSVLALSGYPLAATLLQTLLILLLANLVFVPLALIFHPHRAARKLPAKER